MLAERQRGFADALLDDGLPVPTGMSAERFGVYRANVAVGMVEALRAAFPVVARLVGADFFAAMARCHALETPPRSPVLLAYGDGFADFIAGFAPAASLPYLADVARLEWGWLEAYHAAEAEPLAWEKLAALPPSRLPDLRLALHPSARCLRLAHPALAIWDMHQNEDAPGPVTLGEGGEEVLLVRPHAAVEAIRLPAGGFAFLDALAAKQTIAGATEAALAEAPDVDLAALLALLFGAGAFGGLRPPPFPDAPDSRGGS